ncbi:MAG: TolC family protein, partial [Polyangiaceae bacterium]|nr:TolC family protein [Polyangiaceae bacterium]
MRRRTTVRRSFTALGAIAFTLATSQARGQPTENGAPLSTERALLEQICTTGPHRARAAAMRAQGQADAAAAAVWPNPTVIVEHNQSFTGSQDTETIAGIQFPLGIGGRRFLLSDAAEARLVQRKVEAAATLVDSALDAREVLVVAVAETERSTLMEGQHDALVGIARSVTEVRAPDRAQRDQLRQALEVQIHATTLSLQNAKTAAAKGRLAAFVDRPVELSKMRLSSLAQPSVRAEPSTHPRIAAFDVAIRAADLECEAANRRWVPDLDLFFGYRHVTALVAPDEAVIGHGISFRIGVPITFFDHGQGEFAVAAAQRQSMRAEKQVFSMTKRAELDAAEEALAALAQSQGGNDAVASATRLFTATKHRSEADRGSIDDRRGARALVE